MSLSVKRNKDGEFSIKLGNFTIRGKSTGGHHTSMIIEELSVVFDMGYQPEKVESIQNVFISHGHLDHIGCLPYCHANRKLNNIKLPWQVVMPKVYIPSFKSLASAISSLGRGGYPKGFEDCYFGDEKTATKVIKPFEVLAIDSLVEAESCKSLPLINKNKKNFVVDAYEMKHKITSYGYVISERRLKLKKEFEGLKGQEIKKLRDEGKEVQEFIEIPMIAFTGDTTIDAIVANEKFLKADILIMECTHFDDSIENALSHGHVHFEQFVENISKFENKWIILCHLSQKYRQFSDIEEYLNKLPEDYRKKIIVWI